MLSKEKLRNFFNSPVGIVRLGPKDQKSKILYIFTSIGSLMNDYNHDMLIAVLYL